MAQAPVGSAEQGTFPATAGIGGALAALSGIPYWASPISSSMGCKPSTEGIEKDKNRSQKQTSKSLAVVVPAQSHPQAVTATEPAADRSGQQIPRSTFRGQDGQQSPRRAQNQSAADRIATPETLAARLNRGVPQRREVEGSDSGYSGKQESVSQPSEPGQATPSTGGPNTLSNTSNGSRAVAQQSQQMGLALSEDSSAMMWPTPGELENWLPENRVERHEQRLVSEEPSQFNSVAPSVVVSAPSSTPANSMTANSAANSSSYQSSSHSSNQSNGGNGVGHRDHRVNSQMSIPEGSSFTPNEFEASLRMDGRPYDIWSASNGDGMLSISQRPFQDYMSEGTLVGSNLADDVLAGSFLGFDPRDEALMNEILSDFEHGGQLQRG